MNDALCGVRRSCRRFYGVSCWRILTRSPNTVAQGRIKRVRLMQTSSYVLFILQTFATCAKLNKSKCLSRHNAPAAYVAPKLCAASFAKRSFPLPA